MNGIKTLLLLAAVGAVVVSAKNGSGSGRGKRSPQMPPMPPMPDMPPGMPPMPFLHSNLDEGQTRFARGAPPPPEAPKEEPQAPKRVARQAEDVDQPKAHLRQETLYTSVTTLSRKKRAAASNFITKIHA